MAGRSKNQGAGKAVAKGSMPPTPAGIKKAQKRYAPFSRVFEPGRYMDTWIL